MKDAEQKDRLYAHFVARGWYAQLEVPVYYKGGTQEEGKLITDIDVLALRPSLDLGWESVLGDCKTLKNQSPANRAIWMRGTMEHFSARAGIVVLKPKMPIEPDHKLFASALNVTLLNESDFEDFDRALSYPSGSPSAEAETAKLRELMTLYKRFPRLEAFCQYIYRGAWNENDLLNLLRRIIGETQSISTEVDPKNREHLALILDGIGVFSVALAHCVGTIFKQYLQPPSKEQLDEALKLLIWGGREKYYFISKLRQELLTAKGQQIEQAGPLSLSFWERFIQIVRNMLENPALSFHLPQTFRKAALNTMRGINALDHLGKDDLLLTKYGMLVAGYFCRASRLPTDFIKSVESLFIKKQSDLLHTAGEQGHYAPNQGSSVDQTNARPPRPETQIELPTIEEEEIKTSGSSNNS